MSVISRQWQDSSSAKGYYRTHSLSVAESYMEFYSEYSALCRVYNSVREMIPEHAEEFHVNPSLHNYMQKWQYDAI